MTRDRLIVVISRVFPSIAGFIGFSLESLPSPIANEVNRECRSYGYGRGVEKMLSLVSVQDVVRAMRSYLPDTTERAIRETESYDTQTSIRCPNCGCSIKA